MVKSYNNWGQGSLFAIELKDKEGTLMAGTFFNEAVDEFYDIVQEGRIYQIHGG